jgi:hypothetical protein
VSIFEEELKQNMKNINRYIAMTLITSIASTTVVSSRAWAGYDLLERDVIVQQPVKDVYKRVEVRTVDIPVTRVEPRTVKITDIVSNYPEYGCEAYKGWDHERLQKEYNELLVKHAEHFAEKPVGGAVAGGALGAVATILTGGSALIVGAIGAAAGWLYNWFKGGKTHDERDLAKRKNDERFDREKLQMRCIKNELELHHVYAGSVPSQMPPEVNTDNQTKTVADGSTSGGSTGSTDCGGCSTSGGSTTYGGSTNPSGGSTISGGSTEAAPNPADMAHPRAPSSSSSDSGSSNTGSIEGGGSSGQSTGGSSTGSSNDTQCPL